MWPRIPLGQVLRYRKEFIDVDDLKTYKRCRVQLHGQGVVLRDEVEGAQIKTKKQQVCRAGEFLVAEIDAKLGGCGIVPEELDGAIVSSHYFLYKIDPSKLDQQFLGYFIQTPEFFDQVSARGSTNYAAIRPAHVLDFQLPFPLLAEQRRIVGKIEALAAKVEEAKGLRATASKECNKLGWSILFDEQFGPCVPTRMAELVQRTQPEVEVVPTEDYQFAGVYCFGRGLFRGVIKRGSEFSYKKLSRLKTGQFVYPKLMAWEGALGVVPPCCDGLFVSPEFPVFEPDRSRVLPESLDVFFRAPSVWPLLDGASTGTNVRRRRLQPEQFLNYKFPLPPMEAQIRFQHLRAKLDVLEGRQAQTAAELDALLPAILDRAFKGEL